MSSLKNRKNGHHRRVATPGVANKQSSAASMTKLARASRVCRPGFITVRTLHQRLVVLLVLLLLAAWVSPGLYAAVDADGYMTDIDFTRVPPHIKKNNLESDPMYLKGYIDVTLYDGYVDANNVRHSVDPTGNKDSTVALQKAIDDAYDYQLAVFFPEGTYSVSDTLRAVRKKHRNHNYSNHLVGSTRGARPVIRLRANSPGFGANASEPKAIISIWAALADNDDGSGIRPKNPQFKPWGTPASAFDIKRRDDIQGYDQTFTGIDIDCNGTNGNSMAIGLHFGAAQNSSLHNVKIIATGAYAGFREMPHVGGGGANVEVIGGKYGIEFTTGGAGSVIAGAVLRNQEIAGLSLKNFVPDAVVGFKIIKDKGPAIIMPNNFNSAGGTLSLIDGSIELRQGGVAIDNGNGLNLYARNVYVTGTDQLIKNANNIQNASGTWKRITEYAYTDQHTYSDTERNKFNSFRIIDGVKNKDAVVNVVSNAAEPPAYLIRQHLWSRLPSFEDADVVDVVNDLGLPVDSGTDLSDRLQQIINDNKKIFLPKGKFNIGKTLILNADTKIFGASRFSSRISSHPDWKPTAEVPMVTSVDDSEAETYLGTLRITYSQRFREFDYFNPLHWRAGRKSMVLDIHIREHDSGGVDPQLTNPHSIYKITGNGGGRWYFLAVHPRSRRVNEDYRLVLVDGTAQPLQFYGFNIEKANSSTMIEFKNAENIRAYSMKMEGSRPLLTVRGNSQNIAAYSSGAMRSSVSPDDGYFQVQGASNNILFANINPQKRGNKTYRSYTLLENSNLGSSSVEYPGMVSLFKRGELDDAAMRFEDVDSTPKQADSVQARLAPVIDNVIDPAWSTVKVTPIDISTDGSNPDAADISGSFRALWDEDNLYLLVEVNDDAIGLGADAKVWNDDGVEIYIDANNDKNGTYEANADDYQYQFRRGDATVYETKANNVNGVVFRETATLDGYRMEIRIPWSTIGQTPSLNALLGLEVQINDDDNDDNLRDHKLSWSALMDNAWKDPSVFGTLKLISGPSNQFLNIKETAQPLLIDGHLDAAWITAGKQSIENPVLGAITDTSDLSGSFRTLWDQNNLYILVDISDDILVNDSLEKVWNDDSIEIFIDANNDKGSSYGSDDYQYQFRINDATVYETKQNATQGVVFSQIETAQGYRFEVRIPWTTLGQVPGIDAQLGVDVSINDDDGEANGDKRDAKLSWSASSDNAWQDPRVFGNGILTAGEARFEAPLVAVTTPLVIDGELDPAWYGAATQIISKAIIGVPADAADLSASMRTLWDVDNLYVLVEVNDDLVKSDSGLKVWNDDGIELYIDANNDKAAAYGSDDYQYQFSVADNTVYEAKQQNTADVEFAQVQTASGYRMEIRIPWAILGQSVAINQLLGLDLHVNDDDDADTARDKKISWSAPADNAWQDPSLFGSMYLYADPQ